MRAKTLNEERKKVMVVGEITPEIEKYLEDNDLEVVQGGERDEDIYPFKQTPTYDDMFSLDLKDLRSDVPKWARGRVVEPVRTEPKIGRNEPCPCGSGLKHKKCCLNDKAK